MRPLLALSLSVLVACPPKVGGPVLPDDSDDPVDSEEPGDTDTDADSDTDSDTDADSDADSDTDPGCPRWAEGVEAGRVSWGELSGMVAASTGGVLWGHSDAQGRGAYVYAFDTDGTLLGTFTVAGATNQDWEDIARGPGPVAGASYLYLADTGDNAEVRSGVQVYRFEEPTQFQGGVINGVERFELRYPDGAHDAESLLIDPLSGDLVIVERDRDDQGISGVFVAEAPLSAGSTTVLDQVGTLFFGSASLPGDVDATAGDVSSDGRLVMVRTHDHVWVWPREPGQSLYSAFEGEVCESPLVDEYKGEALAIAFDGSGYHTGGEGSNQPLNWFAAE